jgi:hypothetical protein
MLGSGRGDVLMRRQAWPLAVTLGAHAVLALLWLNGTHKPRPLEEEPRRLMVLLLPKAAPVKPPVAPPRTVRPNAHKPGAAPRPLEPVAVQPQRPANLPSTTPLQPEAITPPHPSAAAILDSARRDIGKIDRELRGKHPNVLGNTDTPWRRFEQAVAGAHNDTALAEDSYTSPDGTVVYRRRMGHKTVCRKTGSVGPPAPWRSEGAILAGAGRQATLDVGGEAGDFLCPESDPGWKKR